MNDEWDPRKDDFNDPGYAAYTNDGPAKYYSKSLYGKGEIIGVYIKNINLNLKRAKTTTYDKMKDIGDQTFGISTIPSSKSNVIKNITFDFEDGIVDIPKVSSPMSFSLSYVESILAQLSPCCEVLSMYIPHPNEKSLACGTTIAIVRVKTMNEVLELIEKLDNKPPLNWRVSLARTKEEKDKREAIVKAESKLMEEVKEMREVNYIKKPVQRENVNLGRGKAFIANVKQKEELPRPSNVFHTVSVTDNVVANVDFSDVASSSATQQLIPNSPTIPQMLISKRPCILCGEPSTKRCSVCKAGYCSSACQMDDWFYHKEKCIPPPPLEDLRDIEDSSSSSVSGAGHQMSKISELRKPRFSEIPKSSQNHQIVTDTLRRPFAANIQPCKNKEVGFDTINNCKVSPESEFRKEKHDFIPKNRIMPIEHLPTPKSPRSLGKINSTAPQDNAGSSKGLGLSYSSESSPQTPALDITMTMKPRKEFKCLRLSFESNEIFSMIMLCDEAALLTQIQDDCENSKPLQISEVSIGDIVLAQSIEDESLYRAIVTKTSRKDKVEVCFLDYGNEEWVSRLTTLPTNLNLNSHPALGLEAKIITCNSPDKSVLSTVLSDEQINFRVVDNKNGEVIASVLDSSMKEIAKCTVISKLQIVLKECGLLCPSPSSKSFSSHSTKPLENGSKSLSKGKQSSNSSVQSSSGKEFISGIHSSKTGLADVRTPPRSQPNTKSKPSITSNKNTSPKLSIIPSAADASKTKEFSNKVQPSPAKSPDKKTVKKFFESDLEQRILNLNEKLKGILVWSTSDCLFFQIEKEVRPFTELLCNIQRHCSRAPVPENVRKGELVCAYSPEEATFNRAEVVSVLDRDKVVVRFMDYGNEEEMKKADLRVFHPSFTLKPIAVKLLPDEGTPIDVLKYIMDSVLVTIIPTCQNPLRGHVMADGEVIWPTRKVVPQPRSPIEEQTTQRPLIATEQLKAGLVKPVIKMYEDYESTSLPIANDVEVVILHSAGPLSVFLIAKEHLRLFDKLESCAEEMNSYCNSVPNPYYVPKEGEVCLAKFTEDDAWYRATCVCVCVDSATMFFVDYGNIDTLPFDRLVQMVDKFTEIDLLAVHCCIKGFDIDDLDKNADFTDKFNSLLSIGTSYSVKVLEKREDFVYVIEIPALSTAIKELKQ